MIKKYIGRVDCMPMILVPVNLTPNYCNSEWCFIIYDEMWLHLCLHPPLYSTALDIFKLLSYSFNIDIRYESLKRLNSFNPDKRETFI